MAAASGRELKVAVVGATGAVGEQIVELIDARALPCAEVALFATERGATETSRPSVRRCQSRSSMSPVSFPASMSHSSRSRRVGQPTSCAPDPVRCWSI